MRRLIASTLVLVALATSHGQLGQAPLGLGQNPGQGPSRTSEATKVFDAVKDSVFSIETDSATGTGFLFRDNTTVATCYHVIEGSKRIVVKGSMDASWNVTAVRYSEAADIALLTIDRASSRKVLGTSEAKPVIGQRVFVIGDALGVLTRTLSEGIVSGLRSRDSIPLVQVTAAISPGVSGAPVLDSSGNVSAVVSFTFSKGQSLNLAIDATQLEPVFRMEPLAVEAFFTRSAAAKPLNKPSRLMDDAQTKQLARLASQAGRAYVEIMEKFTSASEKVAASEGFSRYWASASGSFTGFGAWDTVVSGIDQLDISMRQYANAEAESDARRADFPPVGSSSAVYEEHSRRRAEAREVSSKRHKELNNAYLAFGLGMFRFDADQTFLDALEPAALIHYYGDAIQVSKGPLGDLVPDYGYPYSCVVARAVLEEGMWERVVGERGKTFEETVNALAIVQAGERVYAVQVGGGEMTDVRDWRDVYRLTKGLKKESIGGREVLPTGVLLIGNSRAAAKRVAVTFGTLLRF